MIVVVLLAGGCSSSNQQAALSYETKMRRAETAFRDERTFEARKWVTQALAMKPRDANAQVLMAKVIDQEIVREKSLPSRSAPEELNSHQKELQIKTWLERSRGFLEYQQFDEALRAAEQVFQLDSENLEASRLVDQIHIKARETGKGEEEFLQELYQQEIKTRTQRYAQEAEGWIREKKWGPARFAVEKILALDPKNEKGRRLLAFLDKRRKTA